MTQRLTPEDHRAIAEYMRTAARSNLQAAISAARMTESIATSAREQLELLAKTMAAYDDALTGGLAPTTPHD